MKTLVGWATAAIVAVGALAPQTVYAQAFPSKPLRIVVPYAAGGATDIIARAAAAEMTKSLGQSVIVENRPGAGANLGAELVARAAPDGYTMLMSASSLHGINPPLFSKLNYDPNKDLAPVIVLAAVANVLVVNPAVKANSVQDLVALAKAQPGKLTCASSGSGSTIHMSCEMFKQKMGVDIAHVPYKGSGPAIADLLGGHVNIMFDNIPSAIPHIRSGKLRALATTGGKRDATLTDLPTMAEAGVAGYESTVWFGLVAPAGTPKDVVDRLNAAGRQAAKAPDFSKRLSDLGYGIVGDTSPEQMASMIQDEVRRWGPIVKASGARID